MDRGRDKIFDQQHEHPVAKKTRQFLIFCQLIAGASAYDSLLTKVSFIGSSNVLKSAVPGVPLLGFLVELTVSSPSISLSNILKIDKNF